MDRLHALLAVLLVVMVGVCGILAVENHALSRDCIYDEIPPNQYQDLSSET